MVYYAILGLRGSLQQRDKFQILKCHMPDGGLGVVFFFYPLFTTTKGVDKGVIICYDRLQ